jgi:hypothetical protein
MHTQYCSALIYVKFVKVLMLLVILSPLHILAYNGCVSLKIPQILVTLMQSSKRTFRSLFMRTMPQKNPEGMACKSSRDFT